MADNPSAPSASGGTLLGTNQLQSIIDKFANAVNKLDSVVGAVRNSPTGLGQGGNGSSAQQGQQYGTFPQMQNPFQGSGTIKPVMRYNPATGQVQPTGAYGFSYAGQGGPGQSYPNGGGSAPGGPGRGGLPATFGQAASGMWSAVKGFGAAQLPVQTALSAYVQQGTLAAPNGMSNGTASRILLGAAVGTGPSNINSLALNASDAIQGQALINMASGAFGGRSAIGGAMTGGANLFGYTNPTLGYTGSAQLAQTMYSPAMSMRMMQLGYGVTPRGMGGGRPTSAPAVLQAILARAYQGRRSVNQTTLNAGLGPNGHITYNLQALGYSGSALTGMENTLSAYNRLANAGYTNSQISSLFAGARADNQGDINKLTAAGITQSDLQVLKNRTAAQSATSGNEMQGFTRGLQTSVGLLTQFNKILSFITGGPLGHILGWAGGIGSGAGLAKTSGVTGILGNLMGMAAPITGLFGGSAPGGATTSQSGPSRSAATSVSSGVSGAAKAAVGWAEKEIGVPYVWGGETPGKGFDCSGLMQWAYSKAGVKIPRTSQQQWAAFQNRSVPLNSVQEGDLVFNAGQGDGGTFSSPGHVAMMVSGSQIIEAPFTGANVRIRAYNPSEWQHAARPTGSGATGTGPGGTGGLAGSSSPSSVSSGSGSGAASGGLSSTSEAANLMAALSATGSGSGGGANGATNGGVTTSTNGTSSGGPSSSAPAAPSSVSGAVAIGKQMAAKRGWTGSQWNSLYALWQGESGWRWNATNSQSGAYGIPQSLPASKMASAGADWRTNPATQERWGMDYIASVYGNPGNAYSKWLSRNPHWYGQGTRNARRGLAIVGDRGPELVDFKGGEGVAPLGQASSLLLGSRKSMGGGCVISLSFGTGAIQISGAGGSDVSHSAREIAHSIGRALQQEAIIKKIAAGVS